MVVVVFFMEPRVSHLPNKCSVPELCAHLCSLECNPLLTRQLAAYLHQPKFLKENVVIPPSAQMVPTFTNCLKSLVRFGESGMYGRCFNWPTRPQGLWLVFA